MDRRRLWSTALLGLTVTFTPTPPTLAQLSDIPDAEIEECLEQGELGGEIDELAGVTQPVHLGIDCPGVLDSAVFKDLDEHLRGVTRLPGGGTELNFSDSYKYERAAYLLDRQLGLNMVPVAVIRSYKGDEGALVAWIEDAVHEGEVETEMTVQQTLGLRRQKAVMRLFDALIYNVDRRPDNWLVDSKTFHLYLIDHSRSFRVHKNLPEAYTAEKAWLTRDLYDRLQQLDESTLTAAMDDLISRAQVRSVLQRRDRLIEKIDHDRKKHGDEAIFFH